MKTQNDADAWLGQQVGQHLDYDHVYGQQCVDFFNFYYRFISGDNPFADGYAVPGAKDLWNVPTDKFTKIPDSNNLLPSVGDVLIYGPAWGGGYGHVEVCRWSDANGCHVIGENEHNNANEGVVEVYRSWSSMRGLIGVMRPRFAPEPAPQPALAPTPPTPDPVPSTPVVAPPTPVPTPSDPPQVVTPAPVDVPTQPVPAPVPETPAPQVVASQPTHISLSVSLLAFLKKLLGIK